jgi:hypothetical protein
LYAQILRHFLEAFRAQSRPQEQLVQAASLLVMPMLEAGYEAGEDIVEEEALQIMVTNMFDPPDELASARAPSPPPLLRCLSRYSCDGTHTSPHALGSLIPMHPDSICKHH